ncbi:HAD-IA family hydrolase [Dactylosporangium sp. CA-152071]|uniref:HAD-IA family hydrolase n=1 Tax=Dactylosporangium sp. CA-152071 TaxID=3239933 RepID=UPI003D94A29C
MVEPEDGPLLLRPVVLAGPAAVVFDLDGVLVDSFDVMREAFAVAYAEVVGAGPPPFEEYSRHMGRYFPDIMAMMGLPGAMEEPFVRESYRLAHRVRVYDGVPEMLGELRANRIRLAVATGKSGSRARSLICILQLHDYFDAVVGSDEVPRPKPAPDIVLEALRRIDVAPEAAMMVGDAPTDLASAQAAGVVAVAATWGEGDDPVLRAASPDALVRNPAQLLELCRMVPKNTS